jgi:hypothetical protein
VDIAAGRVERTRLVGGRYAPTDFERQLSAQAQAAVSRIDFDALEQSLRQRQETLLEKFGKTALPRGVSSVEELKRQFEEQIGAMREGLARAGLPPGQAALDRGSEGIFRIRFDLSGERFCAATSGGVRVYSWNDILKADNDLPNPILAVDVAGTLVGNEHGSLQAGGYIYDFDLDPDRDTLLFGGIDGRVRFVDLASGHSGILLEPPAQAPILRLALSRDRTTLALTSTPDMFARGRNKRGHLLQFWDYQAICQTQSPPGPA